MTELETVKQPEQDQKSTEKLCVVCCQPVPKGKKVYCSEECKRLSKNKRKRIRRSQNRSSCVMCGKPIWKDSTYCRQCSGKAGKLGIGKKRGKPKGKYHNGRPKGVKETHLRNYLPESKNKIIEARSGTNSNFWLGESVGYGGVHQWVKRRKPKPLLCERCHERPSYDLANISKMYLRDIGDYEWICRKCHMETDGRLDHLALINKTRPRSKTLTLEEREGEHRLRSLVRRNPDRFNVGDII